MRFQIRLSIAGALAATGLFAGLALAQGSLADYQRGQELQKRSRGLVVNAPGPTNWIAESDRFWYYRSVQGGTEFLLVDATTAAKKPAFDHDKLAAAISAASGGHYTGLTLPFAPAPGGRGGGGGGRGGAPAGGASDRGGGPAASVAAAAGGRSGANAPQGSGGWGTTEIFETYNTVAPAVTLDCEDYGLVFRLAENRQKPMLRLELDAQLLGEQPVFNTVATIKGSEKPNEYVMLSAHFDSWDGSSGATDNGTGTMMAMEAMRILKAVYPHPKRTIMVGHWASEEQGLNGSTAFTEDHPEVMKGLQALFNQDNGTGRIQNIGGGGMAHSGEHINMWLSEIPSEWKDAVRANVPGGPAGGGSDDYSFTCYGVPTSGLGALNWDYGSLTWHTERDTYDKVVFDDLRFNATFTAMMAYLASEDPTMIPHEKIDLTAGAAAPAGGGRGGARTWPACEKAPRVTAPRLK